MSTPLPLENDPQDVALDTDGDILIDPKLGLVFVRGIPAMVQAIRIRILMFFKEWFMNQDVGIPYWEELIGDASKVPGVKDRARAVFAAAVLSAPGVVEILQLDVKIDTNRKMTVITQARGAFGDTPVITVEVPNG